MGDADVSFWSNRVSAPITPEVFDRAKDAIQSKAGQPVEPPLVVVPTWHHHPLAKTPSQLNGMRVVHESRRDAMRQVNASLAPYGHQLDAAALTGNRWTGVAIPTRVRTCGGSRR